MDHHQEDRRIDHPWSAAIGIIGFFVIPVVVMRLAFVPATDEWAMLGVLLFGGLWLWAICRAADFFERKRRERKGIQIQQE